MMRILTIILLILGFHTVKSQDEIPYEDRSNYKFELDYNFKNRVLVSSEEYKSNKKKVTNSSLLPYVKVLITLTNLPEDRYKVRVVNDLGIRVLARKLKPNMQIIIDMGFADDIKDGIGAHQYDVVFEDKSKKELSKIVIDIDEDGNFLLNNQWFGKI